MIIVTTEYVAGYKIKEMLGIVSGNTVRCKHIGRDIMAGLKNIMGGELAGYTELLTESRAEAINRMIENAKNLGANAVVGVRFSTSAVTQQASEISCYGTAVVLEKE